LIRHEIRVIPCAVLAPGTAPSPPTNSSVEGLAEGPQPAAAVIDVLRATTTLTRAFSQGAAEALFFATPEAARRARRDRQEPPDLICGERAGRPIPGFDLGNSPLEYNRDRVAGRRLLFASTNGSVAFLACAAAPIQWAVGFVNISAAVRTITEYLLRGPNVDGRGLQIVCAGKLGAPAAEDLLCAALLVKGVSELLRVSGHAVERTGALLPDSPRDADHTERLLRESDHGSYLCSLGDEFVEDVRYCAGWDTLANLPTGTRGYLSRSVPPGRQY
jgi:2-phosphosulfolactate phosphatase